MSRNHPNTQSLFYVHINCDDLWFELHCASHMTLWRGGVPLVYRASMASPSNVHWWAWCAAVLYNCRRSHIFQNVSNMSSADSRTNDTRTYLLCVMRYAYANYIHIHNKYYNREREKERKYIFLLGVPGLWIDASYRIFVVFCVEGTIHAHILFIAMNANYTECVVCSRMWISANIFRDRKVFELDLNKMCSCYIYSHWFAWWISIALWHSTARMNLPERWWLVMIIINKIVMRLLVFAVQYK